MKWTLSDALDMTVHTFAINPDPSKGSAGAVDFEHEVDDSALTAAGPIVIQRQPKVLQSDFVVTVLAADEYRTLWDWYYKGDELTLTDDLGRSMLIYLTSFDAQRIRSADAPWHHEIACRYLIL